MSSIIQCIFCFNLYCTTHFNLYLVIKWI